MIRHINFVRRRGVDVGSPRDANVIPTSSFDWPLAFIVGYLSLQLSLLFLGSTQVRLPLRIGAYSISLGLALMLRPGRYIHPAAKMMPLILSCLVIAMLMPGSPSVIASIAQMAIYIAILAPLWWVSRSPISAHAFQRLMCTLWLYSVASASVGVLQMYYPGNFQGQLSTVIENANQSTIGALTIQLADGSRVWRPMGLTDTPGGASSGGMYAILFGVGIIFTSRSNMLRILALLGMVVGLFAIYLTWMRTALLMAGIGLILIAAAFIMARDWRRAGAVVSLMVSVALVGSAWAFSVGGDATAKRFGSLLESSPDDVYTQNRGMFLSQTFGTDIFNYPLGAGAGRWGMINYNFANGANSLWAEIMWTAWLYDGGIPLMLLYAFILCVALHVSWRVATTGGDDTRRLLRTWGAVVVAYDVAVVMATFDFPVFGTQTGLEFWFINACLYAGWKTETELRRPSLAGLAGGLQGGMSRDAASNVAARPRVTFETSVDTRL